MLVQPTYQQIHEESAEQAIIQKVRKSYLQIATVTENAV